MIPMRVALLAGSVFVLAYWWASRVVPKPGSIVVAGDGITESSQLVNGTDATTGDTVSTVSATRSLTMMDNNAAHGVPSTTDTWQGDSTVPNLGGAQ